MIRALSSLVAVMIVTAMPGLGRADPPRGERRVSVLVQLAPDATGVAAEALHQAADATVTGRIRELRLLRISVVGNRVHVYRKSPLVRWVERERVRRVFDKPNDPLFWMQWPFRQLKISAAWRKEPGTTHPVTVAVVDTGIDMSHPDLAGRVGSGHDFVNNDDSPQDDNGHGTHVSGVIAANSDNREGIAGMSWGAKVMPLKACDSQGTCSDFALVASIVTAATSGAKVVNLSLGGASPACPRAFQVAARFAEARGVLLVAAVGNTAAQGNPINYPAGCDGYLGVGATDPFDRWARFSSHAKYVDLTAPGVQVLSTLPPDFSDKRTPGYGLLNGTSMAAPHVSGLAALLFSARPEWEPVDVKQKMERTAKDLGKKGWDPFFGHGRINVAKAVRRGWRP